MRALLSSNIRLVIPTLLALLLLTLTACGGDGEEAAVPAAKPAAAAPTTVPVPVAKTSSDIPAQYYERYAGKAKYGGTLIEGHIYENDHWSPWVGCCNRSVYIARNPYNLLVMMDPIDQVSITGDLATYWEWAEDGNSVTFHLAENATWFDGKPVTAEDVKYSLDQMANLDQVRPRTRNIAPYYKEAEPIDAHTVKVHTDFPNPAALLPFLTVDFNVIHPKHILEGKPGDPADYFADPENIVGSGAFEYVGRELGSSIELKKNENYFKEGLPYLDGLKVFIISDKSRLATALEVGQVDITPGGGWTEKQLIDLRQSLEGKGSVPMTPSDNVFRIYQFNYNNPPVDDPRVRRAIYLAFDSKEQVEIARMGIGGMGTPFFPGTWMSATAEEVSEWPGFRYVDESGKLYIGDPIGVPGLKKDPADIQAAKDLLAEAGHADGLKLDYLHASIFKEEAIILKEQLKVIDIELNLIIVDTTTAANMEQAGEYVHMHGFAHGTNILDPDDVFIGLHMPGGPRNALKYDDPRITEIFERQKSITDQGERRKVIAEAEEILRQGEAHGRPMFWHPLERFAHTNVVKNVTAPMTVQYGYGKEHIWLER